MWLLLTIIVLLVLTPAVLLAVYARQAGRRPRIICLMYHRLAPRAEYDAIAGTERIYTVPLESFERQVASLRQAGWRFVRVEELLGFVEGAMTITGDAVLLTFDDGCESIFSHARPILERYGACATVFVTTDPASPIFRTGRPPQRRMTDAELQACDRGSLRIASHAVSHRPLRGLGEEELRAELAGSRETLERILGRAVTELALPGNWYDAAVLDMARQCGYRAVWCSRPGTVRPGGPLFGLPRINVDGDWNLEEFLRALTPWGIAQRRLIFTLKSAPGRLLGPRIWSPIRRFIISRLPGGFLSFRRWRRLVLAVLLLVLGLLMVVLLYSTGR